MTALPEVERWRHLVNETGRRFRADGRLGPQDAQALAQIHAESNGQADAISPAGATGLAQIMPKEWPTYSARMREWFVDRPTHEQLLDPAFNIRWQFKIMADNMEASRRRGDPTDMQWKHGLLRYYSGSLDGWDLEFDGVPSTPDSGRDYVNKIDGLVASYTKLPTPLEDHMPAVKIHDGVATDAPDVDTILKHVRVWPEAMLEALGTIHLFPHNATSPLQGSVGGRYFPHGYPFSITAKPAIGIREDRFRRRTATGDGIEFGGFVLDHEMGHHAAQVIFGIYNPRVGFEGVEAGYTQEIVDRLHSVYGTNGISDGRADEDLAEALHDWWGRHASRKRGRQLLVDPDLVSWMAGLTTGFAPAPPWIEPRVERPAEFLRGQAQQVDAAHDAAGYIRVAEETIDGLGRLIYALVRDSDA